MKDAGGSRPAAGGPASSRPDHVRCSARPPRRSPASGGRPRSGVVSLALRYLAGASFLFYCAWNAYWLLHARLPPAIFRSVTGLPAPTTGGVRAMRALAAGEWGESLRWNPMAVPLTVLLLVSLGRVASCLLRRRPVRLPDAFAPLWCAALRRATTV